MALFIRPGARRWCRLSLGSALLTAATFAAAAEHGAAPASADAEAHPAAAAEKPLPAAKSHDEPVAKGHEAPAAKPRDGAAGKSHEAPAAKSAEGATGGKPAEGATADRLPARPEALQNPIDRLRERLAQRLGAAPAPGAEKSASVMRVVSKANPGSGFEHDLVTSGAVPRPVAVRRPAHAQPAPGSATTGMSGTVPGEAHWDYGGEHSPDTWAQLKPEFSKCATGNRQSPIDIRDGIRVELEPVAFDYKPSGFRVIDNGHTIQVNVGAGNSIEVGGRRYDLIQFHFHRPSEERINGRQFDMVVHLVHRDLEGRLAVIAVLLNRGNGLPAIQNVWNNLPLEKGDDTAARTLLDPSDLLPSVRSYYTYMGSLTTPPCSEGVLWMVMKTPMPISAEQIGIFARLYPMNARPIQASSGRLIKESN